MEETTRHPARWVAEASRAKREGPMITYEDAGLLSDCPACGGWYPDDGQCECGYCPHAGVIEGICPACGTDVEPTMAALIAELLDAADCVVTELARTPVFFSLLASALPTLPGPVNRLHRIVTQLQGTAGLRVVSHG